jgi:hypothetical protein
LDLNEEVFPALFDPKRKTDPLPTPNNVVLILILKKNGEKSR